MKRCPKRRMNKRSPAKTPAAKTSVTRGAKLGAEIRKAANNISDEKRQQLRSLGMSLIYGGSGGTPVHAVRR